MSAPTIKFDDGAVYERMMGKWSGLAGRVFIDWLSPPPNLRWVDIGCGNGAFTKLLVEHCAPMTVEGVDPSEGQLAFARERLATPVAKFRQGDAMALPFADGTFDAAVMALVVFFIPDLPGASLKWLASCGRAVSRSPMSGTSSAVAARTRPS